MSEVAIKSGNDLTEINLKVADHYGYEAQSNQLIEECAELIQAVNKYRRARGLGQVTPEALIGAKNNLIEEIVDVEIMLEQIKYLMRLCDMDLLKMREYKILRTVERMRGKDK